jgi:membrane-associated protease RseP (regulator of RpoE activity)
MRSLKHIAVVLALLLATSVAWAGEPHSSYLGVDVDDVTHERAQALKLKSDSGVEITMVDNDAPAGKAGLKEHDVILKFNGSEVESVEALRRMIKETPPGRVANLTISRDGSEQNVPVTLGDRAKVMAIGPHIAWAPEPPEPPQPRVVIPPIHIEMPDMPAIAGVPYSGRAGMVIESLTPQLGEYFGVKNGEGALVRSVEKGSPAAAAGLRAGDVILKIDQQKVSDRSDVRNLLRNKTGKVPVVILRDKKEQTLTLALPDRSQSSKGTIVLTPEDFDIDLDEIAELAPEAAELAMEKAAVEMQKHSVEMKHAMEQAQVELRREMEKQKHELKRQQEDMKRQQKEEMKQQKEMLKEQLQQDDDED